MTGSADDQLNSRQLTTWAGGLTGSGDDQLNSRQLTSWAGGSADGELIHNRNSWPSSQYANREEQRQVRPVSPLEAADQDKPSAIRQPRTAFVGFNEPLLNQVGQLRQNRGGQEEAERLLQADLEATAVPGGQRPPRQPYPLQLEAEAVNIQPVATTAPLMAQFKDFTDSVTVQSPNQDSSIDLASGPYSGARYGQRLPSSPYPEAPGVLEPTYPPTSPSISLLSPAWAPVNPFQYQRSSEAARILPQPAASTVAEFRDDNSWTSRAQDNNLAQKSSPTAQPFTQFNYPALEPNYPPPKSGYPATQTNYPAPKPSNPVPQPSYPTSKPNYPAPQPNYPSAQSSYPTPQPSSQSLLPGYLTPQSGYPTPQPSNPTPQPSYPTPQPSFPTPNPTYPTPQPSYHSERLTFPGSPNLAPGEEDEIYPNSSGKII